MSDNCKFCNKEFGLSEERYIVQEQWRSHGKWNHAGFCCENCIVLDGGKVRDLRTRTWRKAK